MLPSCHEPATVAIPTILPLVVEIQQPGPEGEEVIEMSGCGRQKRAPHQIGDLNGCLCGLVVNPGVDFSGAINCRQPGCKTQWVHSTDSDYSSAYQDATNNKGLAEQKSQTAGRGGYRRRLKKYI